MRQGFLLARGLQGFPCQVVEEWCRRGSAWRHRYQRYQLADVSIRSILAPGPVEWWRLTVWGKGQRRAYSILDARRTPTTPPLPRELCVAALRMGQRITLPPLDACGASDCGKRIPVSQWSTTCYSHGRALDRLTCTSRCFAAWETARTKVGGGGYATGPRTHSAPSTGSRRGLVTQSGLRRKEPL